MFDQSKGRVGPIFARSDHLGDLPHLMYSKVFRVLLVRVVCSYSYLRILFSMQRNEAFYCQTLRRHSGDFPPQDASSLHKADSSVPSQDLFSQPEGNRSTVERNNVTRLNYNVHHPVRRLNRHETYHTEENNAVIVIYSTLLNQADLLLQYPTPGYHL